MGDNARRKRDDWRHASRRVTIGVVRDERCEPETDPSVLFVCSGNLCRSPMAAGLLAARTQPSSRLRVSSAGFLTEGQVPPPEVVELMAEVGVDLSGHRSRIVDEGMVAGSSLVIGMTRQHVIDLVLQAPRAWERCFTLPALVRRGAEAGARRSDESIPAWVSRMHADRRRSDLMRLPLADDVPDPMGGSMRDYERVREILLRLTDALTRLVIPA